MFVRRRNLLIMLVLLLGAMGLGGSLFAGSRMANCASVPLLADNLLPNATLVGETAPNGWSSPAPGVELRGPALGNGEGFDLDGDGRALQLIGIANYAQTPPIDVQAGQSYCFVGRALTDSHLKASATRLQVVFHWLDAQGQMLREDVSDWQSVVLWRPDAPPADWSRIAAAFRAPERAASLQVRLRPASDDRVYLDVMQVRRTTNDGRRTTDDGRRTTDVVVSPWPNNARAALSFSFDWETAMGGLIHSRSVDDPNSDEDYLLRGMRMREGVTTTLELFRPYSIRATYYANGYNFLNGNTERRQFMGNPTFTWADTDAQWKRAWDSTPWFANDPYGSVQTHPEWYFGDLIPLLQRERQDIQSHTFSHLHGGLASTDEWRADLAAWREVAAEQDVPQARSLAFPWSSSAGMSDANWQTLAEAGITSVTRTNWTQDQYDLFARDERGFTAYPQCKPVPAHESILACPDFYLTQDRAQLAIEQIDRAIETSGMIDLWAHTEEVVSPQQIAAWGEVVRYAAEQRDAGKLWIAPLAEIAEWQAAVAALSVDELASSANEPGTPLRFTVTNNSQKNLSGVTFTLPFEISRIELNDQPLPADSWSVNTMMLDVSSSQTVEVAVWQ
jgi:hypothetical protein